MKVCITFEHGEGELNPFHIPTMVIKDGVETLHDLAFLFDHAARAGGWNHFDGVSFYKHGGEDIATSTEIDAVHFGVDNRKMPN